MHNNFVELTNLKSVHSRTVLYVLPHLVSMDIETVAQPPSLNREHSEHGPPSSKKHKTQQEDSGAHTTTTSDSVDEHMQDPHSDNL